MSNPLVVWAVIVLFLFGYSIALVRREKTYKTLAIIALLMCIYPITGVLIDCYKDAGSEACVWNQGFLPLYLAVAIFIATPLGFLVYHFGRKAWLALTTKRKSV